MEENTSVNGVKRLGESFGFPRLPKKKKGLTVSKRQDPSVYNKYDVPYSMSVLCLRSFVGCRIGLGCL